MIMEGVAATATAAGLAAGFDKDAEAIKGLMGLGLGFMEVGETPAAGSSPAAWRMRRRAGLLHSKLALCNLK
jgi:dihydroorotate dehydrogenase